MHQTHALIVKARLLEVSDAAEAELAEIDENLGHADLSPAERALHVARRKAIYEQRHPETRSVRVRGGPGRGRKNQSQVATGFIDDTAGAASASADRSINLLG